MIKPLLPTGMCHLRTEKTSGEPWSWKEPFTLVEYGSVGRATRLQNVDLVHEFPKCSRERSREAFTRSPRVP